jgi:hypothetical protein
LCHWHEVRQLALRNIQHFINPWGCHALWGVLSHLTKELHMHENQIALFDLDDEPEELPDLDSYSVIIFKSMGYKVKTVLPVCCIC